MMAAENRGGGGGPVSFANDAKLIELLRNLTSTQSKLSSDASKGFIKILKSDSAPKFITSYIKASSKCTELLQAWELQNGKPGFPLFLKLVAVVLSHPFGKSKDLLTISGALDKFARVIVEEKMEGLCKELTSKDSKRQKAVLLLLVSVVRRGPGLAWEVVKRFDFKMQGFSKLAEWEFRRNEDKRKGRRFGEENQKRRYVTREEFVGFAMSFLEVGDPRLLREILQQKDMFSRVLRGLGDDDDEVVVYVLLTLRDRLLVKESLVPPALRSVLFGSATLEQLVDISGRVDGGVAAELAHSVLLRVCTDPVNGLMPDSNRKGNVKRLLDLLKKLKATEVEYHKHLLLAVVKGRPAFGSGFLDEFPHNLENHASPYWFSTISLAAEVLSSVGDGLTFELVNSQSQEPLPFNSPAVQDILRCIAPRPFTRLVINKGLLHSKSIVKHATLRFVLMELELLDSLMGALSGQAMHRWASLKQDIQNAVQIVLPDPQVLLSLLSSLNGYYKSLESRVKRPADQNDALDLYMVARKKLKTSSVSEDTDMLISGVTSTPVNALSEDDNVSVDDDNTNQSNSHVGFLDPVAKVWGIRQCSTERIAVQDSESLFYSKLLDVFKIYHRTLPMAVEGSYDFFKLLPSNPLVMPTILQQSLLSLLKEQVMETHHREIPIKTQPLMYKYLNLFINMFMYSPIKETKDCAQILAQAAMFSTGAFDTNPREICTWFLFIPGHRRDISVVKEEIEVFQKLSSIVTSFLCDAVSTTGNNLFKYMDLLRGYTCKLDVSSDVSPNFSPLVVCVLEKCLRLLSSESGSFTVPEKSMISLYVSTTLKYLLETQVEARLLSSLINLLLSERLESSSNSNQSCSGLCEWRPLNCLLCFVRSITIREVFGSYRAEGNCISSGGSFSDVLLEVRGMLMGERHCEQDWITMGFSFSMICATPVEILQNFPSIMSISSKLGGVPFSLLVLVLFLEPGHLVSLFKLWPDVCYAGLEGVVAGVKGGTNTVTDKFVDCPESSSISFSSFVKAAPFLMLFPAIFLTDSPLVDHSRLQNLLLDKLLAMKPEHCISALCHVLFYLLQARMSYRVKPIAELEKLCESAYFLAEHILKQLLAERMSDCSPCIWALTSAYHIQEVAKIMFSHPLVTTVLEFPLPAATGIKDDILTRQHEDFLHFAEKGISRIDHLVLKLLRRTSELLVNSPCDSKFVLEVDRANKEIAKSSNLLVQKLIATFKERFTDCMKKRKHFIHLIPTLYALTYLNEFIHPSILLELVTWLFSTIDQKDTADVLSFRSYALSVGLQVTSCALNSLRLLMSMSEVKKIRWNSLTGTCSSSFDFSIFEKVCLSLFDIATHVELDVAYKCLLKAVKIVKYHRHMGKTNLCLIMAASKLLPSIPLNFISHCMHKITQTKAELLFLLSEMSSMHLCEFGYLVSDVLSLSQPRKVSVKEGNCNLPRDVDELFLLLPTILLHIDASFLKFSGKRYEYFENIASFFWKMLVQGLSRWTSFSLKDMFEIELLECSPSSIKELGTLFSSSLLGKAVLLMEHHLHVSGHLVEMKERLSLYDSVCPQKCASADFLNFDISNLSLLSLEQPLNFANRVVAKIRFCRLLLFTVTELADGKTTRAHSELSSSRIQFLGMLVSSWQHVVEKFHTNFDNSGQGEDMIKAILRFLEIFIVKNILDSMAEMRDCSSVLNTFPFADQLAKSSLLHRFEDPETLKMLQNVLRLLPHEGKFSCFSIFQLLIAHSQFSSTILFDHTSSGFLICGRFTTGTSTMRSFVLPCTEEIDEKNKLQTVRPYMKKLELVRLLRLLIHIMVREKFDFGTCSDINLIELVSLLLLSYGATISEIDIEIYSLINDIEAADQSLSGTVAKMDYIWGSSALKVRKEVEQIQSSSSLDLHDTELLEERRRNQFKENLPIDPKLCLRTVHCFPYDRSASVCTSKIVADNFDQRSRASAGRMLVYDPVFILRFSIHGLTMEYIEPLEFASLGLLAVAFMTLSSPDGDLRKLGYEAIVRFKSALEKCRKKKDVMRLRLLLSYLQNGIEEEGERIPSATAVFVAEASFIVLDATHDHYSPVSKALMKSSGANMKGIPLFQEFFSSCTAKFKSERLWMLRLLNSALPMDDDTQILVRCSIFETILNFYASSLSDVESKELIFQMVKNSVRLPKLGWNLVVHSGIVPWLSSLVVSFDTLPKDQISDQLAAVVEVASDIILARSTSKWLEEHGFEQLAELASHLYRILVVGTGFERKQTRITDLILQVLMTTLKISQKRRVYQPHLTLSFEDLYELYKAIDACNGGNFCSTTEIGLKTILMSIPPVTVFDTDENKLSEFVYWAISTAMQSHLTREVKSEALWCSSLNISEEHEEDLVSKLLRWLVAAVINGRLSKKLKDPDSNSPRLELNTLQSLLDFTERRPEDQKDISCVQILCESMFYIQQQLSTKWKLLPSVVSALSLLLFSGSSAELESELGGDGILVALLFQKINSPAEANPAWRWSFYQPWRDHSTLERCEVEKLEEIHACQKLLVVISKKLGGQKSLFTHFLTLQDVENSQVFNWERTIIDSER